MMPYTLYKAKRSTEEAEMSFAHFEVVVKAQEEFTEAIEVNFDRGLHDQKVCKDDRSVTKHFCTQNDERKLAE